MGRSRRSPSRGYPCRRMPGRPIVLACGAIQIDRSTRMAAKGPLDLCPLIVT